MGRIYKAFQIKIDKDKKVTIPPITQPQTPPKEETAEDIEKIFQELSPEHLAGSGLKCRVDDNLAQQDSRPSEKSAEVSKTANAPIESTSHTSSIPTGPESNTQAQIVSGAKVGSSVSPSPVSTSPSSQTPTAAEEILSSAASAVRENSAMSVLKRKALELVALEQKLREWEQSLIQRESAVLKEEEKFHHEMMTRRQTVEEEIKKQLEMAKKSAETIMSAAKTEAESLRKAVAAEIEAIKQKAYKEGFALGEEKGIAAGEKAGLEEIRLDWQNLMQETELLINELQTSRMGLLKSTEEEMVRLVIAFAKRVLKVEPLVRPEIILQNIDAALNKIAEVDKIVIRINLKDKSMTESHKQEFLRRLQTVSEVKIVEDSSLAPGGVKIETSVGTIDASIETQAQELENQLMKFLKRSE